MEVRRTPGKQPDPIGGPASRVLEIKVKLHLPELLRNADHSLTSLQVSAGRLGRGLSVGARVDFTHAPRGEISLIAPFQHSVRLDARVRTVPPSKRAIVHPIVRALKWQQMLDEKVVPHRFALAAKMGVTPGAVTKVLRLMKLLPEIQGYLASLKSRPELWHFSLTRMGSLAALPAELQRSAFDKMKDRFTQGHRESLLLPAVSVRTVNVKGRNSPRLSAG